MRLDGLPRKGKTGYTNVCPDLGHQSPAVWEGREGCCELLRLVAIIVAKPEKSASGVWSAPGAQKPPFSPRYCAAVVGEGDLK